MAKERGRAGLAVIREMDRIVNYTGREPPEEYSDDKVGDLVPSPKPWRVSCLSDSLTMDIFSVGGLVPDRPALRRPRTRPALDSDDWGGGRGI